MLNAIALLVIAAIALLLIYAATRPDHFRVTRTTVIKAPAPKIHALINDLKSFNTWNPFEKKDPSVKGSYSGALSGVGAAGHINGESGLGEWPAGRALVAELTAAPGSR